MEQPLEVADLAEFFDAEFFERPWGEEDVAFYADDPSVWQDLEEEKADELFERVHRRRQRALWRPRARVSRRPHGRHVRVIRACRRARERRARRIARTTG